MSELGHVIRTLSIFANHPGMTISSTDLGKMMANAARIILLVGLCLLGGCDNRPSEKMLTEARLDPLVRGLDRVGRIYMGFHDAYGKGPGSWQEMNHFAEDDEDGLKAIALIRSHGYTFKWRVIYSEVGRDNAPEFVLAESRRNDAKLTLDGKIRY